MFVPFIITDDNIGGVVTGLYINMMAIMLVVMTARVR